MIILIGFGSILQYKYNTEPIDSWLGFYVTPSERGFEKPSCSSQGHILHDKPGSTVLSSFRVCGLKHYPKS